MQRYELLTVSVSNATFAALSAAEQLLPLASAAAEGFPPLPADMVSLLREWAVHEPVLRRLAAHLHECRSTHSLQPSAVRREAPLLYPGKVICTGANYHDHLAEMTGGKVFRKEDLGEPYFFFKPPSTTVVGHDSIVRPPAGDHRFDWEVELTAVIGRKGRDIAVEQALEYVAGYTVGIDLTARGLHQTARGPLGFDWFRGKSQDTHCPLGPSIVPAQFVRDPQNVALRLSVNGVRQQNGNTSQMIFSVAEQISAASRYVTLEPGDVLLTGTPAGVGHARGVYLKPGDEIVAEAEGIGQLRVRVRP